MWNNVHVGDFGWVGKLRIVQDKTPVDISSYTTLQFIFLAPNGDKTPVAATFDTDGTDGVLKYVVANGLINKTGPWRVWARIAKTGAELTSEYLSFRVERRLDQ